MIMVFIFDVVVVVEVLMVVMDSGTKGHGGTGDCNGICDTIFLVVEM